MRRFDENSEHAKHGMAAQEYVWKSLPGAIVVREHMASLGVTDRTFLNLFEKQNGDIWYITKGGKLFSIEVASAMPGRDRISVGQSKIELFKGGYYCFVLYENGPNVPTEICFAKRDAVLLYLRAIPEYNESKNGGEPYKFFLPKTFRKGIHSVAEFLGSIE